MPTFLLYILKAAICLTLLYSLYGLMLRRETFHRLNRAVLLLILAGCMVLPAVRLTTSRPTAMNYGVLHVRYYFEGNTEAAPAKAEAVETSGEKALPHWLEAAMWIYAAGLLYSMGRYGLNLLAMVRLLRCGRYAGEREGCRLVISNKVGSPFSWMRWVVISESDLTENGHVLLAHEAAHVRLRHSWDMLLCELVVRLQWFNPFGWLLREDLRALHEYQADSAALGSGIDAGLYQLLLVRKAVGTRLMPAANSLSQSSLKQRFVMMYTAPSARSRAVRSVWLLPCAAFSVWAFAEPEAVRRFVDTKDIRQISTIEKPAATQAGFSMTTVENLEINIDMPRSEANAPLTTVADTANWTLQANDGASSSPTYVPKDMGTGCAFHDLKEDGEIAYFLDGHRVSEEEMGRHVTLRRSPDGTVLFAYIPKGQSWNVASISACDNTQATRDAYGVDCPVITVELKSDTPATPWDSISIQAQEISGKALTE